MEYRHYNTGDQVWVRRLEDGHEVTAKFITSNGIYWTEEEGYKTLSAPEKLFHKIVSLFIRGLHRVMKF